MYINEATKQAVRTSRVMYRKSAQRKDSTVSAVIEPTNSYSACLLIIMRDGKAKRTSRCWNPTADDLIAGDWEIMEKPPIEKDGKVL